MEVIIIFALIFFIHIASMILHKRCSNLLSTKGSAGKAVYILITGIFSSFLYFAYSGFSLEINAICILFAFLYGICSVIAGITITIYNYADVAITRQFIILFAACRKIIKLRILTH